LAAVVELGRIGIWCGPLRRGQRPAAIAAVAEAEALGYGAAWLPAGGSGWSKRVGDLLGATDRMVVATGIVNIHSHPAAEVAAAHAELVRAFPGRFLLGIGVGHREHVDRMQPGIYGRPLTAMRDYLDELDAAAEPVPAGERILAALGPRMLDLARERSAGSHPYNVTSDHTRAARERLGRDRILAPAQAAVLETDRERARAIGRRFLATYLGLPNYTRNLLQHGFTSADIADAGSDRLVDALVVWGDADDIVKAAEAHLEAGADHVCLQLLDEDPQAVPTAQWRRLAEAFGLSHRQAYV
jgi:probable F420-dependent oxidoreductase